MKKLFIPTLLILFFASTSFANPSRQDFIIIDDIIIYVTPNDCSTVQQVTVELLDENENVQAFTTTEFGNTVSFTLRQNSKFVRTTYPVGGGNSIIIVDIIIE
jgi:hypothetical protein